jgi:hypothetical protein
MTTPDAQRGKLSAPLSLKMSDRAKARLRIAAALLGRRDLQFEAWGEDVWSRILRAIDALDRAQRQHLRELVDWVEAYECAEAARKRAECRAIRSGRSARD